MASAARPAAAARGTYAELEVAVRCLRQGRRLLGHRCRPLRRGERCFRLPRQIQRRRRAIDDGDGGGGGRVEGDGLWTEVHGDEGKPPGCLLPVTARPRDENVGMGNWG